MNKFSEYFGLHKEVIETVEYPDSFNLEDELDAKLAYLKALETEENSRQTTIETKTSQLVGQAGIIFSLLSLFIANYISKFTSFPGWVQVLLSVVFLITLCFYLCTIFQATRYLNIRNFHYARRNPETVKTIFASTNAFKIEEIKDLIYSLDKNTQINTRKANFLLYAYRSFRIGTIGVGVLTVLILLAVFLLPKPETPKINIEEPIQIQGLDSSLNKIKGRLIIVHDTVCLKQ
jgi:hypothetical protein